MCRIFYGFLLFRIITEDNMLASPGNVILAFLRIYLIFGFLTIFVFSKIDESTIEERQYTDDIVGCTFDCHYKDVSVLILIY